MEDTGTQAELDEAKKNLEIQRRLRQIAESENEELKKQIERLASEISELKKQLKKEIRDAQTQTDGTLNSQKDKCSHHQVSQGDSMVAPDLLENGADSLAETLKQTAEAAISSTGYVMDEASGMYYDYNSGYYYDPNSCLFYDPRSGTYFYYNEESNTYEFHSKVDVAQHGYPQGGVNDDQKLAWEAKKKTKKKKEKNKKATEANNMGRNPEHLPSSVCGKCNRKNCKHKRHKHRHRKKYTNVEERRKVSEREEVIDEDYILISDEDEGDFGDAGDENKNIDGKVESVKRNEEEETEDMETEHNVKDEGGVVDDHRCGDSDSEMEDGEIIDSSEDSDSIDEPNQEDRDSSESGWTSLSLSSLSEEDDEMEDEGQPVNPLNYPPCVRLIVVESKSLPIGSLHIVTVTGGTIGREGSGHILKIPDIGVSKKHAEFIYDQEKRNYTVRDLGSQNGTSINGTMIASVRTVSEAQLLSHKDVLQIGSTSFTVHIHPGTETCDDCEPGLVQAKVTAELSKTEVVAETKADKETLRRKELKNIKKKYHLVGEEYKVHNDSTLQGKYQDRAEQRRQTVGSDNPYQPDGAPASVNRAIDETNKGHQMLMKMGWKKGDSLGKGDTGLKEPIQVRVHTSKAGLGAMASIPMDYIQNTKKISMNWKKAHERFQAHNPLYEGEESIDDLALTKIKLERKKWVQGETEVLGEVSKKGTEMSLTGLVDEPKEKEGKEQKGVKPVKVDIFEDN